MQEAAPHAVLGRGRPSTAKQRAQWGTSVQLRQLRRGARRPVSEHGSPSEQAPQPAAPPIANEAHRLGEQVGRFAALNLRRLGAMAAARIAKVGASGALDASKSLAPKDSGDEPALPSPATARAEELVSRTSALLSEFAEDAGGRLKKAAAFAREEAEDIWAEAQQLRRDQVDSNHTS